MRKKILFELISTLEEIDYSAGETPENCLCLAHLNYLLNQAQNFNRYIEKFYKKKPDEKNLYELEKLIFHDKSFDIVLLEELYYYLENNYQIQQWTKQFIEKFIYFLDSVSSDYFVKPFFLCELIYNTGLYNDYDINKKLLKNLLKSFSNTRWEIKGLCFFTHNLEKIYLNTEWEEKNKKIEFLKEFREHLIFFLQKYPQEEMAKEYLFKLSDFFCQEQEFDEAIKLYSRLSGAFSDEHTRVRILYELGRIYHIKENTAKAVEIYTELFTKFETKKDCIQIKFNAGRFLSEENYNKSAFLIFKEIASKFKTNKLALECSNEIIKIGKKLYNNKKYSEALFYFEEVLQLKNNRDDTSWALFYLGKIYKKLSHIEFSYDKRISYSIKSDEVFKKLIKNYGDNKAILENLSSDYLLENKETKKTDFDLNYIIIVTTGVFIVILLILHFI
ncbi:MAG: tetratricopeptide repeat protein [Candidatus Muiribacteriota bacterium]